MSQSRSTTALVIQMAKSKIQQVTEVGTTPSDVEVQHEAKVETVGVGSPSASRLPEIGHVGLSILNSCKCILNGVGAKMPSESKGRRGRAKITHKLIKATYSQDLRAGPCVARVRCFESFEPF